MHEVLNDKKGHRLSLAIIVMLLILIPVGMSHFRDEAFEVRAQTTTSCDREVVSLVDCSPSTSSSSDDSSAADDSDKKDQNDGDNDKSDSNEDQREEKNSGDIESKIPSTAGGVPFP